MEALFLTYVPVSGDYTAAVTFILLALTFGGMILAGKEFQTFQFTDDKAHRVNGFLWCAAAAMAFFTLVFLLNGALWILGAAFILAIFLVFTAIADRMKDRIQRY